MVDAKKIEELCERLEKRAAFWERYWTGRSLQDPDSGPIREAAAMIRSLSLRVEAEKRAAFDTAHANYLPEDKSNASWKAEMMRRFDENWTLRMQATVRAESAETHSAALARALEEARDELLECKADYHRNPSSVIDKCNAVLTERDAGNEMIDRAEEAFEAKRAAEAHSAELAKVLENILDTYRRVYYMPKPGDGKLMWKAIDEARSLLASRRTQIHNKKL